MILGISILDLILPLIALVGILFCMQRALVRTLLGTLALFLATLISALLYGPIINGFTASLGSPGSGRSAGAIVFAGLTLVFYVALEYTIHRNYPDLRIAALKNWDHILGALLGIVWSVYALSLILVAAEFAGYTIGGTASWFNQLMAQSSLVPLFRAFFAVPLSAIRLLFPQGLPEILRYFAQ
jgi:uncharacterized membrane protein required for colicin V production